MKYKKNEAFVDVVESVNLSTSAKGNVFHRSLALSLSSFSPPCYPGTILRADVDDHASFSRLGDPFSNLR